MLGYKLVWFSNGDARTAKLAIKAELAVNGTVSEISRLYPMRESVKMRTLHVSEETYPTMLEAVEVACNA